MWKGLAMTSAAPARSASTASATVPWSLSTIVATGGRQARACLSTASPSAPGRCISVDAQLEGTVAQPRDRLVAVGDGDRLVAERLDQPNEARVNRGIVVDQ